MAEKETKSADAQLASDVADKSLNHPRETSQAADSLADGVQGAGEEEDDEDDEEEQVAPATDATGPAKKKKKGKKKKKKVSTEEAAETGQANTASNHVAVRNLPSLLQKLAMSQPPKPEGKAPEDYKFWNTQPVPKFKEPHLTQTTVGTNGEALPEGPILPDEVCKANAKEEPDKLLESFEWCLVDLEDTAERQELHDLLENHYVEDTEGSFRFNYSTDFLVWALKPPGWSKDWHIGVRTKSGSDGKKGKLVAFIAGVPIHLKVGEGRFTASEINFLTVHHKLRGKRLAPLLIKEVTRKSYLAGIYQGLYTAGALLPTPITTCRYFHRSLDWEHLYKCGFSHLPPGSTELRQKFKYRLETSTSMKGFRPMEKRDLPAVKDLLVRYLERFYVRQEWSDEEMEHWFQSDASKSVVSAFVVETDGKITDFVSYYALESNVLRSNKQQSIRAAYLYYYATETAFSSGHKQNAKKQQEDLAARLQLLVHEALVSAKKEEFHVFNALTLLDGPLFLTGQKFERGDGKLHYYLFNWRTQSLGGGIDKNLEIDTSKMGGVGVVML